MSASTIALRYAHALLDIGLERKNYEQLGRELERVLAVFQGAPELRMLFKNPSFDAEVRKRVLGEILGRVLVSPLTRNFLMLLVDRRRIGYLAEVVAAFHDLADVQAGRVRAEATAASPLNDAEQMRLRMALQKLTGKQVLLTQKLDPELLGGVITRVGGKVYDGSVRAQLNALRGKLTHSSL